MDLINEIKDACDDNDEVTIQELIKDSNESGLSLILEEIIEDDPFQFELAIKVITNRLFSDKEYFLNPWSKLIKKVSGDYVFNSFLRIITPIVLKNPALTMKIIEKLFSDNSVGICSGVLLYPLLDSNNEAYENVCANLKSTKSDEQLHALTALKLYFIENGKNSDSKLLEELLNNSEKIDSENMGIFIDCLITGYTINESLVEKTLQKEIEKRGFEAALYFIYRNKYQETVSVPITKQALELIEKKDLKNDSIDIALSQIYLDDPDYVICKLRDRISNVTSLGSYRLLNVIKENELDSILEMLDDEIANKNVMMIHFGNTMLEEILNEEELLDWCESRVNDKKSRKIILKILAKILTNRTNFTKSEKRDKAIEILKEIALDEGLDYDKETKNVVNFGKDIREGIIHKENSLKALHMIDILLFPTRHVNIKNLEKNLDNYPNLCNVVGKEWLIKSAKSKNPHILAYIYDKIPDIAQINELAKKLANQNDVQDIGLVFEHDSLLRDYLSQIYWENVFKTLAENGIDIPRRKIQGGDDSILTELEIIARLALDFKITPEPIIEILKPKKLDVLIEHNGQKALIEIAVVNERKEVELAKETAITIPGGKVKSTLLNKFNGQLKKGECDPGIPIILILRLSPSLDEKDVYDAIYGKLGFQTVRNMDKEVIATRFVRDDNSFFDLENTNIISGIVAYKRDYSLKNPLVGKIYRLPQNINPKNNLDEDLRIRIRDALFAESETNDWKSLMIIDNIGEKTAKLLYSMGIEDLETLSVIPESRLNIKELKHLNHKKIQNEANRIILASTTNSIIYLKGIQTNNLDILQKNNIHLITELLQLDKKPDGIDPKSWNIMRDDANRIKKI